MTFVCVPMCLHISPLQQQRRRWRWQQLPPRLHQVRPFRLLSLMVTVCELGRRTCVSASSGFRDVRFIALFFCAVVAGRLSLFDDLFVELPGSLLGQSVFSASSAQAAQGLVSSAQDVSAPRPSKSAFVPIVCPERKLVDPLDPEFDELNEDFGRLANGMEGLVNIRLIDNVFGYVQFKHDKESIVRTYKKCTIREICIGVGVGGCVCLCVCFCSDVGCSVFSRTC